MKVEWLPHGELQQLDIDGVFICLLGKYPKFWLATFAEGHNGVFPAEVTMDEAKDATVAMWRMR